MSKSIRRPNAETSARIAAWFTETTTPTFAVRGNHDCVDVSHAFDDGRDVTGRVVQLAAGIWLAGIGWHGERYYDLPLERDLARVCDDVERQIRRLMTSRDQLILLTHYPPFVPDARVGEAALAKGRDAGSPRISDLINTTRPVLVIEGHNHRWATLEAKICWNDTCTTTIFNPGSWGAVVELDAPAAKLVRIRKLR